MLAKVSAHIKISREQAPDGVRVFELMLLGRLPERVEVADVYPHEDGQVADDGRLEAQHAVLTVHQHAHADHPDGADQVVPVERVRSPLERGLVGGEVTDGEFRGLLDAGDAEADG